jgi:hypothetical protein
VPIFSALIFLALLASLFFEFSSRLRPPPTGDLPPAWSELASPAVPVKMDEPARGTFVPSTFPSWLWKLGRFELRVPLPANHVAKMLKEHLRPEPGYALFLPIGGRAVGWVQAERFQVSLVGDFSRRPSSWIADGAIVPAGEGTILRSDFVLRKSRLVTFALFAVWILSGALYIALTASVQSSARAWQGAGASLIAVVILAAYLGLLRGASWFSGRRLQHFLVGVVSPLKPSESTEPVGYAAMIRDLEDEVNPRRANTPPSKKHRRKR